MPTEKESERHEEGDTDKTRTGEGGRLAEDRRYCDPMDWNKWEVDFMVKITVGVEGMACGMCEAHINDAVRNEFPVKKVTSSQKKKQTVIIAEEDIPEQKIKDVIGKAGYEAVSVSSEPYEKKGLFSAFGK